MSDDQKTPPQPFARKPVTWGRMPATTFHVGPVPVAPNPLDRIPNRPPLKTPLGQAQAGQPQQAVSAGRLAHDAGLMPRRDMAVPSTPLFGLADLG
mgnify:CR=1 FL=1